MDSTYIKPVKPCKGLCDEFNDGICHNFCLMNEAQLLNKKRELIALQKLQKLEEV